MMVRGIFWRLPNTAKWHRSIGSDLSVHIRHWENLSLREKNRIRKAMRATLTHDQARQLLREGLLKLRPF
jgi:hypothetical protein